MSTDIVLTLTGPDRVGIVEEVTEALLGLGGNVEQSRMSRLGGEFAILMLASLPGGAEPVSSAFEHLAEQGYRVTVTPTTAAKADPHEGWLRYRIEVEGADHEGIVHEIARGLSQQGITIESMDTETTRAPVSGTPLFSMTSLVAVPPDLADGVWMPALDEAGQQANVDVTVTPAEKP